MATFVSNAMRGGKKTGGVLDLADVDGAEVQVMESKILEQGGDEIISKNMIVFERLTKLGSIVSLKKCYVMHRLIFHCMNKDEKKLTHPVATSKVRRIIESVTCEAMTSSFMSRLSSISAIMQSESNLIFWSTQLRRPDHEQPNFDFVVKMSSMFTENSKQANAIYQLMNPGDQDVKYGTECITIAIHSMWTHVLANAKTANEALVMLSENEVNQR